MKNIEKKTPSMMSVEQKTGEKIEEYMRRRYVDDNIPLIQLSKELETHKSLVVKWLRYAGIYSRKLDVSD